MTVATRRLYTLAEAAEAIGCHPRTITRAEEEGRLVPPRRDELGHRMYDERDLERVGLLLCVAQQRGA